MSLVKDYYIYICVCVCGGGGGGTNQNLVGFQILPVEINLMFLFFVCFPGRNQNCDLCR